MKTEDRCAVHDCTESYDGPLLWQGVELAKICDVHHHVLPCRAIETEGGGFIYQLTPHGAQSDAVLVMRLTTPAPVIYLDGLPS